MTNINQKGGLALEYFINYNLLSEDMVPDNIKFNEVMFKKVMLDTGNFLKENKSTIKSIINDITVLMKKNDKFGDAFWKSVSLMSRDRPNVGILNTKEIIDTIFDSFFKNFIFVSNNNFINDKDLNDNNNIIVNNIILYKLYEINGIKSKQSSISKIKSYTKSVFSNNKSKQDDITESNKTKQNYVGDIMISIMNSYNRIVDIGLDKMNNDVKIYYNKFITDLKINKYITDKWYEILKKDENYKKCIYNVYTPNFITDGFFLEDIYKDNKTKYYNDHEKKTPEAIFYKEYEKIKGTYIPPQLSEIVKKLDGLKLYNMLNKIIGCNNNLTGRTGGSSDGVDFIVAFSIKASIKLIGTIAVIIVKEIANSSNTNANTINNDIIKKEICSGISEIKENSHQQGGNIDYYHKYQKYKQKYMSIIQNI